MVKIILVQVGWGGGSNSNKMGKREGEGEACKTNISTGRADPIKP